MIKPAIVAVGYNRPDGMKRLLESIGKAKYTSNDVPLIISIDESNKSDEVEEVAKAFEWKHGTKEIRRFPERQGLRKHIIQCGDYSEIYGAVIILEDDLVVANDFYSYVCAAHDKYGNEGDICGVSLYAFGCNQFTRYIFTPVPSLFDVYLGGMVVTWGQSWNSRQWRNFKMWYYENEDKLPSLNFKIPQDISSWTRSWGRYFASFMAEKHLYYIYPYRSRTTCFSDFGEHNKVTIPVTFVQVPLMQGVPIGYILPEKSELIKYDSFYEREMAYRSLLDYPPAGHMMAVLYSGINESETLAACQNAIKEAIDKYKDYFDNGTVKIKGPVKASVSKVSDHYRFVVYFMSFEYAALTRVAEVFEERSKESKNISVFTDFDPMNTY